MASADEHAYRSARPHWRRALISLGATAIVGAAWAGSAPWTAGAANPAPKLLSRTPHLLAPAGAVHTYQVNNTTDGAGTCPGTPCTLRQAITNANADGTLDLITFAAPGTFVLSSTLAITDTGGVIIQGLGATSTVIDGGGTVQVMSIAAGVAANISGITVQNGTFAGNGAGILNAGSLVLDRSVVRHNLSTGTANSGGGIYVSPNTASLWLLNSTLGGLAAGDGNRTDGNGGGLWSTGSVSLQNDVIQNNVANTAATSGGMRGGGVANFGSLDADSVTVAWNSFGNGGGPISGDQGGGIYSNSGPARVQNSTFIANSADQGGGMYNDWAAQVDGTVFNGNTAITAGGGFYSQSGGDQTVLNNPTIINNTVTGTNGSGGGLYVQSNGVVVITGGLVNGNRATGSSATGGGLLGNGNLSLNGTTVTNNTSAGSGGGLGQLGGSNSLTNVLISGNSAAANGGGLYLNNGGGETALNNVTVAHNQATNDGGGVYNISKVTVTSSWIDSNSSGHNGGGLWNSAPANVRQSTLSANTASNNGGGVFHIGGPLQLVNSTVTGNTGTAGGDGLWNAAGAQLIFSTLTGGQAISTQSGTTSSRGTLVSGGCVNTGGTVNSNGFNLEAPGDTCGLHAQSDQHVADAMLGPLGNNGGLAPTVPLLGGSPAIDGAGTNCNVSTDERGIARPQLNGCDIGAYEFTTAGYWTVASDGGVFTFGGYTFYGSMGGTKLNAPVVGMAATPDRGGYFLVGSDGGVFTFGNAVGHFHGSTGNIKLNAPVVGIAAMPDGDGYFLVASDGGVFTFGSAAPHFHGSMGATKLNSPMVGIAVMPDGDGYFLVAADGGVFTFGSAAPHFHGSTGAIKLNSPMVGIAVTQDGDGYWMTAGDGGVFTFGNAKFLGSMGAVKLNKPVVGIAATSDAQGYWLVATDGGIFTFGNAMFLGSMGAIKLNQPMNGMAA
jgi:CSLREA domain-containing protein